MHIEKTARQFAEQPSLPRTPGGDSKLNMIEFHANGFTCLAGELVFTERSGDFRISQGQINLLLLCCVHTKRKENFHLILLAS